MSVEPIGLLTLAFGLLALFKGPDFAILCFLPMALLGSAGAVLLGGAGTIQPAHLMLGFVVLSVFVRPERLAVPLHSATFPREGFWLLLVVGYGIAGAYLLPRLFAGATAVNAIGATDYGPSLLLVPLGPTSGNITQSVYLTADALCFLTLLSVASTPRGFETATKAALAYCAADVAFAAIDIATSSTDTGFLLGFIRNADYQLHLDEVTGGMKRIVGSFTEASSFSYATVGALGFVSRLWLAGRRPQLTGALSLILLALLGFSTSSTAYVATPGLLAVLYGSTVLRAVRRGTATPVSYAFVALAPVVLLAAVTAVGLNATAFAALHDFFAVTLFDKSASQSGLERAQWNATALANFEETLFMGGGLGSIRASSFPLAVLSNLGVVGTVGFAGFLASVFLRARGDIEGSLAADVRAAGRTACAGLLIAATVSGALVDLGLPFYAFAALSCAVPRREQAGDPAGEPGSTAVVFQG